MRLIPGLDRDGLTVFVFGRRWLCCRRLKAPAATVREVAVKSADKSSSATTSPSVQLRAGIREIAASDSDR
jgi:hypothetical protein